MKNIMSAPFERFKLKEISLRNRYRRTADVPALCY